MPQFSALFIVFILTATNLMSCLTAIEIVSGKHIELSRVTITGAGLVLLIVSYSLLVHKARYRKIVEEFASETPRQRKWRLVGAAVYVVFTFTSFFLLVPFRNS
jgi:hypothetical protein